MSHGKTDETGKFKSPLARARGMGSAGEGSTTWLRERLTSLALIPLMLWFVWSAVNMTTWSYADFTAWQAQPVNAVLMILTIAIGFYHAVLGIQVVVEDYIHCEASKITQLIAYRLFFLAAGAACIFSVLKIALMR